MHRVRALFLIILVMLMGGIPAHAQPTPPPTATAIPITFSIWHSWQNNEATLLADWIKAYQETNPNITIEARYVDGVNLRDEVLEAIKRDQGPDLFIGPSSWAYQLAADGRVAPLGERLDTEFRGQIMDKAWDTVKINDFLYGIPESLSTITLFYNSELISADKLPKTVDELIAAKADMMFDFSTTGGIFFGLGGTLINAKGEVVLPNENALFQNYLTVLQSSFNKLKAADTLFNRDRILVSTDRRFRDGKTALLVDGSWKAEDLYTEQNERVQVAPLPALSNGNPWTPMLFSQVFYVNVNANQADGALRFLKYTTSVAGQSRAAQIVGRIPVNPKADAGRYTKILWQQVDSAVVLPAAPPETMSRLWGALDQAVYGVTAQGVGVSEAVQNAIGVVRTK